VPDPLRGTLPLSALTIRLAPNQCIRNKMNQPSARIGPNLVSSSFRFVGISLALREQREAPTLRGHDAARGTKCQRLSGVSHRRPVIDHRVRGRKRLLRHFNKRKSVRISPPFLLTRAMGRRLPAQANIL
jgi:hypothetical protein